ncbi:hypothetical protein M8C21_032203 [Ambrosia artemisiifolia]|uniref:Uncharacterized protein n=1 Tax=Ambrosia artemisiifolia TaxID=4212 RepID=A0AAD5C547_AMBAR|nr:hypothetical protein M8C21_032203 [Ambrosia artemisiifolia]
MATIAGARDRGATEESEDLIEKLNFRRGRGMGSLYSLYSVSRQNHPLMDAVVRCLHIISLYHPDLWLSPAKRIRPPIVDAARTMKLCQLI